jgi:hypothetical protein
MTKDRGERKVRREALVSVSTGRIERIDITGVRIHEHRDEIQLRGV